MVTVIFWQQKQNSLKNIFMAIVWKSKEKSWLFLYIYMFMLCTVHIKVSIMYYDVLLGGGFCVRYTE